MSEENKEIEKSAEQIPPRKSKNREEIARMLERIGSPWTTESMSLTQIRGEAFMDDYTQVMEFIKGKKGRWYL